MARAGGVLLALVFPPDREGDIVEVFLVGLALGFFFAAVVASLCYLAAYRNGVTDGYGYAREPNCPGYAAAGEYLRTTMSHRWPELNEDRAGLYFKGRPHA